MTSVMDLLVTADFHAGHHRQLRRDLPEGFDQGSVWPLPAAAEDAPEEEPEAAAAPSKATTTRTSSTASS